MKKSMHGTLLITCLVALLSVFQGYAADITVALRMSYGDHVMQSIRYDKKSAQPYSATLAKSLFTKTADLYYNNGAIIPSKVLKDCYQDSTGNVNLLWDASSIHPIITKEMIKKAFMYATHIQSGNPIDIPVEEIIPCCLIGQYFLFSDIVLDEFTHAYFANKKAINLNDYFNLITLHTNNNIYIKNYIKDFIIRLEKDSLNLENLAVPISSKHLVKLSSTNEHSTEIAYALNLSAQSLEKKVTHIGDIEKAFRIIKLLPENIINNIVSIDLSKHQIRTIHLDQFRKIFPRLQKIDLSNNNITAINDEFLQHYPHKLEVILCNNPITMVTHYNHPLSGATIVLSPEIFSLYAKQLETCLKVGTVRRHVGHTVENYIKRNRLLGRHIASILSWSCTYITFMAYYKLMKKASRPLSTSFNQALNIDVRSTKPRVEYPYLQLTPEEKNELLEISSAGINTVEQYKKYLDLMKNAEARFYDACCHYMADKNAWVQSNIDSLWGIGMTVASGYLATKLPAPVVNFLNPIRMAIAISIQSIARNIESYALTFDYEWTDSKVTCSPQL